MDRYEIMFIVKNTIEEEKVKKIANSLKDLITNDKGNIIYFKEIVKRKLEKKKKKEVTGTYYVMTVEANHDTIKEFSRKVSINENVLRHLVIKKEGK